MRIPKEFQLDGEEVEIQKKGVALVLRPKKPKVWDSLFKSLDSVSDDFMTNGRKQPTLQKRRKLFS